MARITPWPKLPRPTLATGDGKIIRIDWKGRKGVKEEQKGGGGGGGGGGESGNLNYCKTCTPA